MALYDGSLDLKDWFLIALFLLNAGILIYVIRSRKNRK